MTEVIKYDLSLPVTVRKYEINVDDFRTFLRNAKKNSGLSNRAISEKVGRPITEVEHWFRTDNCFSIPDKDVWFELKSVLRIDSEEYDASVTEFVEKPGVFEKANRFYDISGIAPTITSASADEKIIIDETLLEGERYIVNNQDDKYIPIPFNYVSLFSGIGGFEQALNKLGGTCVLASEIDKFANQAYEVLYGHSTVGDITKVEAEAVPDHDVLVGGFPCQPFSVSGKRGGFEDARGTLFFEMARIAREKQPKIFLAENVKGLLSHDKGRTMDTIVTTLSDIGYRVDFEVLNSKYFGVPQNRERVFLIGIREDLLENETWDIPKGSTVVPKAKRRLSEYKDLKTFNFEWPAQEDVSTRLKDVLEADVDEKYYLSEEKTAKLVAQLTDNDKEDVPNIVHNIYGGFKESKPRVFKDESPTIRTSAGGGHLPSLLEEIRPVLTRHGVADGVPPKYRIRKLTPKECWRLQGFPDEAHEAVKAVGISDSQRYKMAGNAVTVNVIDAIGRSLTKYLT